MCEMFLSKFYFERLHIYYCWLACNAWGLQNCCQTTSYSSHPTHYNCNWTDVLLQMFCCAWYVLLLHCCLLYILKASKHNLAYTSLRTLMLLMQANVNTTYSSAIFTFFPQKMAMCYKWHCTIGSQTLLEAQRQTKQSFLTWKTF